MKIYIYFLIVILSVFSCEKDENTNETWWINSSKKDCVGVGPMSCLQIQKGEDFDASNWQLFYDRIEGFEYEPGYIYQIKVNVTKKVEPIPADASSLKYELVKIVSKEMDTRLRLTNIWKVIQVGEIENPLSQKSSLALVFEFNASEMSYSGDLGCNSVRGSIKNLDESNLEFGLGASTKMACMEMSVENGILQAITNTKAYQIAENQLTLLDENGAVLMLFQAVD